MIFENVKCRIFIVAAFFKKILKYLNKISKDSLVWVSFWKNVISKNMYKVPFKI